MRMVLACGALCAAAWGELRGVTADPSGSRVAGATVRILGPGGNVQGLLTSDAKGEFRFDACVPRMALVVSAAGFADKLAAVEDCGRELEVRLEFSPLRAAIEVSSEIGATGFANARARSTAVLDRTSAEAQAALKIEQWLQRQPGILAQQTTSGAVSPFLRGLTGYQTLLTVDGVRYNNAIFRPGPNQYAALLGPQVLDRIEAVLGPAGAMQGSDALGGSVNFQLIGAMPSGQAGVRRFAEFRPSYSSADQSVILGGEAGVSTRRLGLLAAGSWARHGDLRAGGGEDSRHVLRRFFGLDAEAIRRLYGDRLQDSGYSQQSWLVSGLFRPTARQSLAGKLISGGQDHVRSYRELWGGAGRLQARFTPQDMRIGYGRYEALAVGPFDSVAGRLSFNRLNDGFVQQALRVTDPVTADDGRFDMLGLGAQAILKPRFRQTVALGAERYSETISATRFTTNPVDRSVRQLRALYPNGSRYRTHAVYFQDTVQVLPDRWRVVAGGRYTQVFYKTRSSDNITAGGAPLGVADSQREFSDVTFHASSALRVGRGWTVVSNVGRGFRPPNVNDLGTIGVRELGFDVTAEDAIRAGARFGLDSGDGAGSSGRAVVALRPESLWNYEAGLAFESGRLRARTNAYFAELRDPIVTRTLLFPVNAVPGVIGPTAVVPLPQSALQRAQGVVAVASVQAPRSVKTAVNDGRTQYRGIEASASLRMSRSWSADLRYGFQAAIDVNPVRRARRLPPQEGLASVRYTPPGSRRWWAQATLRAAGEQSRLNGGDIDDDRIGASRRRSDIASVFSSFAVSRYVSSAGVFLPTGETLRQVQDRVLPLGARINGVLVAGDDTRVPMHTSTAGWAAADLVGGFSLTEKWWLTAGLLNALDRNYRVHGSGVDAPGRNAMVSMRFRF